MHAFDVINVVFSRLPAHLSFLPSLSTHSNFINTNSNFVFSLLVFQSLQIHKTQKLVILFGVCASMCFCLIYSLKNLKITNETLKMSYYYTYLKFVKFETEV